jgi:hypothetical protein
MTRNGLYVVAGALMFGASALHASRTGAQTQQQIDWCNNDGNVFSVDQRLSGCTALVESERRRREIVPPDTATAVGLIPIKAILTELLPTAARRSG